MYTITNISNKPVGLIGGQVCLPGQKIDIKDKDALCAVFDEDDHPTGEKELLPGLKVMERRGFITIDHKEDVVKKAVEKAVEKVEEPAEEAPVKKTTTRKRTTKKTAE